MDLQSSAASEARFTSYVVATGDVIGHTDRTSPLHDHCLGLLLPGERKSVEPMAAVTAPVRADAAQGGSFVGPQNKRPSCAVVKIGQHSCPPADPYRARGR